MSSVALTSAETRVKAPADRAIAAWLIACAGMVFAMAIIGAITRLTESGLSIVEWKPIAGTIPPLSEAAWLVEFDKYKATPEYQIRNAGMSLAEFKQIFFWEWFHRLWGRLIGVVFAVPFLWFWLTGRVRKGLMPTLAGLFVLGGLQGALGWYMVMSGLVSRPDVSHYRLAAHLSLAIVIYGALLAVALRLLDPAPEGGRSPLAPSLMRHGWVALALASVTIVWGAFVAGLDAGLAYNSWPLMNGTFAPSEMWNLSPAWMNFVENTAAVQFAHRWLAIATAAAVLGLAWRAVKAGAGARLRGLGIALAVAVVVQVALGISTLLLFVPISLGAMHQGGALVLVGLLVWTLTELRRPA
ncbi:MAG TPA: COX15/CtaA family protein [Azospirillaceae bacterium]|nr:COX15/CtaA family protein [Azospirillaceae bacterium]